MQDPKFIVALVVAQVFVAPVNKALQSRNCNLVDAYQDVALATECIRDARKDDNSWKSAWKKIEHVASAAGITIFKPRTATVQQHRANAGSSSQSSSDYYRINVYYPFIDHVI